MFLNDVGDVLFKSNLTGTSGGTFDDTGLFTWKHGVSSIVARDDDATIYRSSSSGLSLVEIARSTVIQTIGLYKYDLGVWEVVDTRNANRFNDRIDTVSTTGDASRFIESGTNCMQA